MIGFTEKLKNARQFRGLTLEQLAKEVNSSKSYMWQLENDETIKPSAQLVANIAKALGVTVDYLLDPEKEEMDSKDEAMVFSRNFRGLSQRSREILLKQMEALKERDEA